MKKKINASLDKQGYGAATPIRDDIINQDPITLIPRSEDNSILMSMLPETANDNFIGNSKSTGAVLNVEQVGDLPMIMTLPRSQSPFFVTREVKIYCEFYYWLMTHFFSDLRGQLTTFTPSMLEAKYGNLQAQKVADKLYNKFLDATPKTWRNIFGYGVLAKENVLYDEIMFTMNESPTEDTLMKLIYLMLMYEMNKRKDLSQNEELLFTEELPDLARLYTSFTPELLTEVEQRWQKLRFPETIHAFISEVNRKVIADSNLLSGNVLKLRQGDIATEWPFITERYVSYLYVNLFLSFQDILYGSLTAKILRIKSMIENVTKLLQNNKMFILEEWYTVQQEYDALEKQYATSNMIGGVITTDIISMFNEVRRTDSIFELASLMHQARVVNDDCDTKMPTKEETFSTISTKVRPRLIADIQQLVTELNVGEAWLNIDVDHIDTLLRTSLADLGVVMVKASDLSKVSVSPTIELASGRRYSNIKQQTAYMLSIPTDSYIRFKPVLNGDLKDISFLTTSKHDLTELTAVTINRDLVLQSPIPSTYIMPFESQLYALENDIYNILEDYGIIDAVQGDSIQDELRAILLEQQEATHDVIKMHDLLRETVALDDHDQRVKNTDDKVNKNVSKDKLKDSPAYDEEEAENSSLSSESSIARTQILKLLDRLREKIDLLQYMGDQTMFHAPLSYRGSNRYSQILMNLVIRAFNNLYISKNTGEIMYPILFYKEHISKINNALYYKLGESTIEHRGLVPSCNIHNFPSEIVFLPEVGAGISFIEKARSMVRASDAIPYQRYGRMLKPADAYVWTTVSTDKIHSLIEQGEFDAAPANLESKDFYRLDYLADEKYWIRRTVRNQLSLLKNDGTWNLPMGQKSYLSQTLSLHMIKMLQDMPMDWLTGTTESDLRDYKRFFWLSEHYKRYKDRAKIRLPHIPDDISLSRRVIFVFLMKLYGYGPVLAAVDNFKPELEKLDIKFSYPLIKLFNAQVNSTVKTVIKMMLSNEELMERILGEPDNAPSLM